MRVALTGALALFLSGCATLPSSGPTAGELASSAARAPVPFRIVDIDQRVADDVGSAPVATPDLATFAGYGRTDTVGPGDVLDISIYEVGITLFSGNAGAGGTSPGFDPSARATRLGDVIVDAQGTILLPYIGRLPVGGQTVGDIQRQIERGLRGKSQSPQALVSIKTNASNTFYVSGDVRAPGRYALGLPRERLLDAVARAGGTVNQPNDMIVRVTRSEQAFEARLSDIVAGAPLDVALLGGDRVELFNRPRTFLIFGATDKVAQVPFGANRVTLAEALARSGGPSERVADPSAIFLFRQTEEVSVSTAAPPLAAPLLPPPNPAMTPAEQAAANALALLDARGSPPPPPTKRVPVIYRLDMTRADGFFLSQSFELRDKDVIYIANARANAPGKLATILGQLFSPFLIANAVVR